MANEIPASDDELEALMAELEESTGVSAVATPPATKASSTPAAEPTPPTADDVSDEDLDGLDLPADEPAPAVVEIKLEETSGGSIVMESEDGSTVVLPASLSPHEEPADVNVDDELAALEAEIASGTVAPPTTPPWEEPAAVAEVEKALADYKGGKLANMKASIAAAAATGIDTSMLEKAMETFPLGKAKPEPQPAVEHEPSAVVAALAPKPAPAPKPTPASPATISAEEEEVIAAATKKKAKEGLDYYIDVDKFKSEMQVTETNLDNCMMEQASLRAYHGARAARAEAQASSIKARFEVKEAQLYHHHRSTLVATGEKVTEKAVENAVKMDPKWIAMKMMVIEAESIAAVAKSCKEALNDRRDMVIQLGADRRDESKGQARVMQAQADRDNLTNRAVNAARVANG